MKTKKEIMAEMHRLLDEADRHPHGADVIFAAIHALAWTLGLNLDELARRAEELEQPDEA